MDTTGRSVCQALIIETAIVKVDEHLDGQLQGSSQMVVLKQDADLQLLMPALDLALGLRLV